MAEWIYEAGIGENRAALIENGQIVETAIELEGEALRPGAVVDAILRPSRIVELTGGGEAMLDSAASRPEGARLRVRITREALSEPGKPKRAKARVVTDETPLAAGTTLLERIGAAREIGPHDPDALEEAGWSELLEHAASGIVAFGANALHIALTPAMTLIDIDGSSDVGRLLIDSAEAAGAAIRRFGIAGNIGMDFPTVEDRTLRQRAAEIVRQQISGPHEATAINGFGFMQIVRPRERASLFEQTQYDRAGSAARALLRRAQRSGLKGASALTAHSRIITLIAGFPDWTDRLAQELGGPVSLIVDDSLALTAGRLDAR